MLLTGGQVLTVLMAVAFLGEKPTPTAWLGIALVISGIFLVVRANLSGEKKKSPLKGIILGGLSVACMSTSYVIAKKPLDEPGSAMEATFIRMVAGGITMLIIFLFTGQAKNWWQPFRNSGLLGQFFLSVAMITFGGFWLTFVAFKQLDVSIASTHTSVEPLFVLPLGLIFLREKVTLKTAGRLLTPNAERYVKSGAEMAVRTDQLSQALPAIEARARTLALAAERIAGIVDDLRSPHKRPEWEAIE
jgi:uncharacterized membrane protein